MTASRGENKKVLLFIVSVLLIMMIFGLLNNNDRDVRPFPELIAVPDVF
ncbi:hypothetical protein [Heliorestis convoluta]|uniref:Uncharacterized protein n=1 Tax=Heliorestis convoluta TaxID=356322 RepID=A0A5Q2N935_9FIRM|nr:hypothetical protein [Heliorestis convoluta]QGG48770.1 hypothetical protein FTV88_2677 [Heliorestis convoluta]